jgi:hypothetical protein
MRHFLIVFGSILVFNASLSAQIFSPTIYNAERLTTGVTKSLPLLYIQLNGAFRETSKLTADEKEKINGSVLATILQDDIWSVSLGYTLNKTKENVVSSSEEYFNSIVIPDFGGQAFTVDGSFFLINHPEIGLNANFSLGLDKWVIDSNSYKASPGQAKILIAYRPFSNIDLADENNFNLIIRGGISGRFLTANLSSEENLLINKFNTKKTSFWGAEFNVNLLFNDLNLYFNSNWFSKTKEVKDFPSKGVYTLGFILTGNALKFRFKEKKV